MAAVRLTVFQLAMIYGIFCIGLNFFMGYTGQASFGQNAFACIGGYGSAILCVQYGWEPALALIASMVVAGVAALLIGYLTLRLRGHYLAMATFSLGLITYDISIHWTSVTQGCMGYSGIPPLGVGKFTIESERWKLVALTVLMLFGLIGSVCETHVSAEVCAPFREAKGAAALGIRVPCFKLIAFVVAALYASAAGSLFAHTVAFISPEVFGPQMAISDLHDALCRRRRHDDVGPVVGAIVNASPPPEVFRSIGRFRTLAYAVELLALLIYCPANLSALGKLFRPRKKEDA